MFDEGTVSRRQVLRGLIATSAVGLAGCSELDDDDGATDDDPNENEEEDPDDNSLGQPPS